MNEVKPGYKTTEFWISLFAILVSALVGSGAIPGLTPEMGDATSSAVTQIVQAVVIIVGVVTSVISYNNSRTEIKKAAEIGKASVAAAKIEQSIG